MRYYQFHIGDYSAHTRGLSLIEDLSYRRLIDECYLSEAPLEGDAAQVARQIGMPDHTDAVAYILGKFFDCADTGWTHARITDEIASFQDKTQKASRAGKLSAERRFNVGSTDVQQTLNRRSTDVQPPITHPPLPKTQSKKAAAVPALPVDLALFDTFWSAYPKKVAKSEAVKAWIKLKPDGDLLAAIMAGVDRACQGKEWLRDEGQYIPNPASWLNASRWEDEGVTMAVADPFEGLL